MLGALLGKVIKAKYLAILVNRSILWISEMLVGDVLTGSSSEI